MSVTEARRLAVRKHENQRDRDGSFHIAHVARVAERVPSRMAISASLGFTMFSKTVRPGSTNSATDCRLVSSKPCSFSRAARMSHTRPTVIGSPAPPVMLDAWPELSQPVQPA